MQNLPLGLDLLLEAEKPAQTNFMRIRGLYSAVGIVLGFSYLALGPDGGGARAGYALV